MCIAQHESGIRQFTNNGDPLVSPTHDYGIMQINQVWLPLSRKMGLDVINNPKDNISFGVWLANTHGYSQWTTYKQYCLGAEDV